MSRKKEISVEPSLTSLLRRMHTEAARHYAPKKRSSPPCKMVEEKPTRELIEKTSREFVETGNGHGFWYTKTEYRDPQEDRQPWPGENLGHG